MSTDNSTNISPPLAADPSSPVDLPEVARTSLRLGLIVAEAGGTVSRVQQAVRTSSTALGVPDVNLVYNINGLHGTWRVGRQTHTEVLAVPHVGVNMDRLCNVHQLAHRFQSVPRRWSPEEVWEEIKVIEGNPFPYPKWLTVPLLGAACGGFCFALHGGPLEILATFLGTCGGHITRLRLLKRHTPAVPLWIASAFAAALVALLASTGISHAFASFAAPLKEQLVSSGVSMKLDDHLPVIASVLFLIPGVPLVSSLLDLVNLHVSAAVARAALATVLIICISLGMILLFLLTRIGLI